LEGGTQIIHVYGGYTNGFEEGGSDANATYNTVTLLGTNNFISDVRLNGGGGDGDTSGRDFVSGNTLAIKPASLSNTITVANVSNFQSLSVDLSDISVTGSPTILEATGTVTLGSDSAPLDSDSISISGGKDIDVGDKITLISGSSLNISKDGDWEYLTITGEDADGRHINWKIVSSDTALTAAAMGYVTVKPPVFAPVVVGYARPAAETIGITIAPNSFEISGVELDYPDGAVEAFDAPKSQDAGTWTIQPKAGLAQGTHIAAIIVTATNQESNENISGAALVSFDVRASSDTPNPPGPVKPVQPITADSDIASITVSGENIIITYASGQTWIIPKSEYQVDITVPEGRVVSVSELSNGLITAALNSNLIPAGTTLTITATPVDASGVVIENPSGETPPRAIAINISGLVTVVSDKTVITFSKAGLSAGLYRLMYSTPSGSNPSFSGVLASRFEVKSGASVPIPNPKSGGGGCDSGFGAFALIALASLSLARMGGKSKKA
jgi:hypothetical protein